MSATLFEYEIGCSGDERVTVAVTDDGEHLHAA